MYQGNYYPQRLRSRETSGVFSNVGRSMLGQDSMLQHEIQPMYRRSSNGYLPSNIEDLKKYAKDPRPVGHMRASSIPSLRAGAYRNAHSIVQGSEEDHLLDLYSASNNLNDPLGSFGRGYDPNVMLPALKNRANHSGNHTERMRGYTPNLIPNVNLSTLWSPDLQQNLRRQYTPSVYNGTDSTYVDNELKLNIQKQNRLLEDLSYKMDELPHVGQGRALTSRELEHKLKEYKKDGKLRIKLLKQSQKIESLTQNQLLSQARANSTMPPYGTPIFDPLYAQRLLSHRLNTLSEYPGLPTEHYCPQHPPFDGLHSNCNCKKESYLASLLLKKLQKKKKSHDSSDSESDGEDKSKKNKKKQKANKKEPAREPKKVVKKQQKKPQKPQKKPAYRASQKPDPYINRTFNDSEPNEEDGQDPEDILNDPEDEEAPTEIEGDTPEQIMAKSNLRKLLWSMVYPVLLENDVIKKILNRKNAQLQGLIDKQGESLKSLTNWMYDQMGGSLNNLFMDRTLSYDFIGADPSTPLSEQTKKTRARLVQYKLINLFEELSANMRLQPISEEDLDYLASISLKEIYAQSNVFSNYEVMRFSFNTYGRLADLTKDQSQMILAVNLLIRILVYKLVFGVKGWYQGPLPSQALLNFKIVGSILYRLVYYIWERVNPVINQSVSKLPLQTTRPLIIDPNITEADLSPEEPEIIVGAFTRHQLAPIFVNNQDWIAKMVDLIIQWIDDVYKKVVLHRKLHPQKMKE